MKILVIEDDKSLEAKIVAALREFDHEVTSAQCVRDGALAVSDDLEEFDLIVIDVQLPTFPDGPTDNSGLEIVRTILFYDRNPEHTKPIYVHSSEPTDRGIDIAKWLKDNYPSAVFRKKDWDEGETTRSVIDYVTLINTD